MSDTTKQTNTQQLVPLFTPALLQLLTWHEGQKGAALTRDEVLSIRDKAVVMMVPAQVAAQMEAKRGGRDLIPEQIWEDWQAFKRQSQA